MIFGIVQEHVLNEIKVSAQLIDPVCKACVNAFISIIHNKIVVIAVLKVLRFNRASLCRFFCVAFEKETY